MKLAFILMVAVLAILFIIWNFVGSGEHHKSKNVNRLFDILVVVALLVVLVLGMKVWYSEDMPEEEVTAELEQYYNGSAEDEYDAAKVSNYQELQDSKEMLSSLQDSVQTTEPSVESEETGTNLVDGLKNLITPNQDTAADETVADEAVTDDSEAATAE